MTTFKRETFIITEIDALRCHLRFHRIGIQSDAEDVDPLAIHDQLKLAISTFIRWRALIGSG